MKDVLVERWRNGLRNISDLETYGGVEVSLCTRNARRRKIRQILASQTMRKYLRGSSFQWLSDDVETRFYESLKSKEAQRALWKSDPSVRKNVGDAISRCLETLETTGVDNDTKELNALWVETFDDVDDADEDSDEEFGPGSILDSKCLTRSEADAKGRFEWNARQSGTGTKLSLGDQGSLKVLAKATESCPLIVEWNGVTSKLGKEVKNVGINKTMFGKGAVMDHGEYMKGSWSGKPLPVIILIYTASL
ncbi:hypothetical protein M7I_7667 [Glarea lozoyensis 74030]|uniref:Uncharacterized protein n=1 Tax=Glarea lozoyensis (strain ATCC 74030 / MF5533) TaxID=1104152 RepID=H0EXX4_GLAL7|nr:hypothetical protein M7I_7667 [Glarea lozoyensis 74030]